jgi:hypothetical protein
MSGPAGAGNLNPVTWPRVSCPASLAMMLPQVRRSGMSSISTIAERRECRKVTVEEPVANRRAPQCCRRSPRSTVSNRSINRIGGVRQPCHEAVEVVRSRRLGHGGYMLHGIQHPRIETASTRLTDVAARYRFTQLAQAEPRRHYSCGRTPHGHGCRPVALASELRKRSTPQPRLRPRRSCQPSATARNVALLLACLWLDWPLPPVDPALDASGARPRHGWRAAAPVGTSVADVSEAGPLLGGLTWCRIEGPCSRYDGISVMKLTSG